jgi:predicted DCC family thiol-disulfide oxidoreductase YuxK
MMKQMYVIDRHGGRHGGAVAIRYLSRRLPSLWLLAPLLHIPFTLPLWSWLYNQIAIRRYRMNPPGNCENGACEIHFRK